MSDDIKCKSLERIKSNPHYSIHLGESTDVSNAALLLVFVRYCADVIFAIIYFFAKNFPREQVQMR